MRKPLLAFLILTPLSIIILMGLLMTPVYCNREITLDAGYDGSIEEGAPFVRDDSSGYMLAYYLNDGDRMFIEWNISTIPDTAIIDDLDLRYYHHQGNGAGAGIYAMGLQPSVHPDTDQGNTDIYTDAKNGTKYGETTGQSSSWTWYTKDLGANADAYLEANLTNDWWAIGVESTPDSVYWGTEDNSTAAQLIVTYHLPDDPLYVISNPVYENNTDAGTVTVTVLMPSNSTDEAISATTNLYTSEEATVFYWDIGDGYSRYIYTPDPENFTVTLPEDTDAVYAFTIKDYSNRIGNMDAYLEAYRTINGVETLITRQIIYDQLNAVPLSLVVGKTYIMKALFSDGYLHEFGYYTTTSDTTHTYSISDYQWTDRAQTVYNDVTAEASRPNATHIQLVYAEEIPGYDTLSANMTILFKSNGTQATKVTSSGESTTTLHWYDADNETDYVAILNGEVEHFGGIQMSWVLDYTRSYNTFPQLDAFGDWGGLPVGDLIAITSSLIVMGCFSFVSRKAAPFMAIGTLAIFTRLGGASFTDLQLGVGFSLSLLYGLVMGAED